MPVFDLLIRNARVVRPTELVPCDIGVSGGRIVECSSAVSGSAGQSVDAEGRTVLPGLVDPHVHFNEPGRADWEGIASGSAALAAGGGTCYFDMPLNSLPPLLDGAAFDAKIAAARAASLTDFALWGGLTPLNLDRLEELAERGVIGFKAFMCDSGLAEFPYTNTDTLARGMQIAARLDLPVAVHAEDQALTSRLIADCKVAGRADHRAFLESRPIEAERMAIQTAINLARETGCDLHIVHVSCDEGVALVTAARRAGVRVTCETCPHYLFLHASDLDSLGTAAKCAPPLRPADVQARLWRQLLDGQLDFIASDHSPAPPSMKQTDSFMAAWGGIAGVQSTLPLLLTEGVRRGLTLPMIVQLTSQRAADRYGIPTKGRIEIGADADLVILSNTAPRELTRHAHYSRHKLSPYTGRQIDGLVDRVYSRGRLIVEQGRPLHHTGGGQLIRKSCPAINK